MVVGYCDCLDWSFGIVDFDYEVCVGCGIGYCDVFVVD